MFPSLADQEQDCLVIGIDTGLFLDFVKVVLGVRGDLDSSLRNFPPPFGQVLVLCGMNCLSHAIDYSKTDQ